VQLVYHAEGELRLMKNLVSAIILAGVGTCTAWGALSNCPNTSDPVPSESLDNINTGGGCQIVDKQFSNFTSTQSSTIEMLDTSNGGVIAPDGISGLQAVFGATGIWNLAPHATTTSTFDYQGQIDPGFPPPASGTAWHVNTLTLGLNFNVLNAAQLKTADTITVRMEWCPNATTVDGCANLQFIQGILSKVTGVLSVTYSNSAGNSNSFLDVNSLGATSFAVRDTLTFIGSARGSTFPLDSISNGFDEAGVPEPSTITLLGIGLTGLGGLFIYRKKKRTRCT
jgi:PEP-CTERM motif